MAWTWHFRATRLLQRKVFLDRRAQSQPSLLWPLLTYVDLPFNYQTHTRCLVSHLDKSLRNIDIPPPCAFKPPLFPPSPHSFLLTTLPPPPPERQCTDRYHQWRCLRMGGQIPYQELQNRTQSGDGREPQKNLYCIVQYGMTTFVEDKIGHQ